MSDQMTSATTIERTVLVQAPQEHVFRVFTERMDAWWPRDYHIGEQPMQTAIVEPREGGRWFERAADGSECDWGTVLVWEPPHRVVLTWQIDPQWRYEPDAQRASEVEVRFEPEGGSATRVTLEHRELDRHGEGWEAIAGAVGGSGGWTGILERLAATAGEG